MRAVVDKNLDWQTGQLIKTCEEKCGHIFVMAFLLPKVVIEIETWLELLQISGREMGNIFGKKALDFLG